MAEEVRKVAEKSHTLFPRTNIIISILLPRKVLPWQMIQNVNKTITMDCSSLRFVSISHHHTLICEHLYDNVHLDHEGVRIFAKDLKNATLGRVPQSNQVSHQAPPPRISKEREEANLISADPDTDISSPYQNKSHFICHMRRKQQV